MANLCVIPARLESSRFPQKPLAKICGFEMVGHVAKRCVLADCFAEVVVATCNQEIIDFASKIGIKAIMTSRTHERASDRTQEATEILEKETGVVFDTVTMVQGDEPMVTPEMLKSALQGLISSGAPVVNLRSRIKDRGEFLSHNCVKVVCDSSGYALYFSREPIPSPSRVKETPDAFKQVCIIPFARNFLDEYSSISPTPLEIYESIDMLRVLEKGHKVFCVSTDTETFPVDVPQDLMKVESLMKNDPLVLKYV